MSNKILYVFTLLLLLYSCGTYSEQDKTDFDKKIKNFIKKSGVKYQKSESGLYYAIETVGEGEFVKLTDEVSFTYEGKLLSGEIFDGENKKKPITFKVNELIQGWQEALLYLKKGGKIQLLVPPQLGYGDYELDDIPVNSILYFHLEVVDVN
ncbi:MAG: FKBP-type peptidyl-prolyl cis-trans isomerase [Bacteroidota bacterium]